MLISLRWYLLKWKNLAILGVVVLVCVLSVYFIYPFFNSRIDLLEVEADGNNLVCYLQYFGRNGVVLDIVTFTDSGRIATPSSEVVNNGEVFVITIVKNVSMVEITFDGKTVTLHSDGTLS